MKRLGLHYLLTERANVGFAGNPSVPFAVNSTRDSAVNTTRDCARQVVATTTVVARLRSTALGMVLALVVPVLAIWSALERLPKPRGRRARLGASIHMHPCTLCCNIIWLVNTSARGKWTMMATMQLPAAVYR